MTLPSRIFGRNPTAGIFTAFCFVVPTVVDESLDPTRTKTNGFPRRPLQSSHAYVSPFFAAGVSVRLREACSCRQMHSLSALLAKICLLPALGPLRYFLFSSRVHCSAQHSKPRCWSSRNFRTPVGLNFSASWKCLEIT